MTTDEQYNEAVKRWFVKHAAENGYAPPDLAYPVTLNMDKEDAAQIGDYTWDSGWVGIEVTYVPVGDDRGTYLQLNIELSDLIKGVLAA